jgi:pyruvate,water dikinase
LLESTPTILSKCKLIIPLENLTKADVKCAGSKAANLGELLNKGFNIPDCFVLTTEAFEHFLKSNSLNFHSSLEEVENATLPTDIKDQLLTTAEPYINTSLAVRSSGIAEDLEGASFAGQYETILDVIGPEELISAVKKCWVSAYSTHVSKYQASKGNGSTKSMAVLIQRLVKANTAGVAFSANPVTGDRNESIVNAVNGLGDRLVSGKATPDEWVVRDEKVHSQRTPEGSINADQVLAIANLVKKVEDFFGTPQDIEWAIEKGERARAYTIKIIE